MRMKARVLAAAAGSLLGAAVTVSEPALADDRLEAGGRFEAGDGFGQGGRGAVRPPAGAMLIFDEPGEFGIDTRGRSVGTLDRSAQWPFVPERFRRPPPHPPLHARRDRAALTLNFGGVSGFALFESGAPWVGYAPPYYRAWRRAPRYSTARPPAPRHPQAPVVLKQWPHAPWFRDAPRYRHARPNVHRRLEPTRLHRARPHAPGVYRQWHPAPAARQPFRRWGD